MQFSFLLRLTPNSRSQEALLSKKLPVGGITNEKGVATQLGKRIRKQTFPEFYNHAI